MKFEDMQRLQDVQKKLRKNDFKRRVLEAERDELLLKCDHIEGDGEDAMGSAIGRDEVCSICGALEGDT